MRSRSVSIVDDVVLPVDETFAGDVVVHGTGVLRLDGILDGHLRVQAGGIAVVNGSVCFDATNTGGHLLVFGRISGRVHCLGGRTYVDPVARVSNAFGEETA